jgi:hypothetical protein
MIDLSDFARRVSADSVKRLTMTREEKFGDYFHPDELRNEHESYATDFRA